MKVRNIFVSEKDAFEELLILELIHHQIGYVQIEDEFHFLDYIYRFYDQQDLNCLEEKINMKQVYSPLELFKPEDFITLLKTVPEVPVSTNIISKRPYHKLEIKMDNQVTNQYMKRYQK